MSTRHALNHPASPDVDTGRVHYPIATGRYDGRQVLITGAATGLGLATAARLASEGASIGLVDRHSPAAEKAAERLRGKGYDAIAYGGDVTDRVRMEEVVKQFRERGGSIDTLVTMAGVYPALPFEDMTWERWREVIDVNLGGTFVCAHAVMPTMKPSATAGS
jgi:NAD(P)-dependent dehydrogenase (short-subunit alcohol dehydrogenase family)